eukprot:15166580-Alexandrium_andersonii.AAC.1
MDGSKGGSLTSSAPTGRGRSAIGAPESAGVRRRDCRTWATAAEGSHTVESQRTANGSGAPARTRRHRQPTSARIGTGVRRRPPRAAATMPACGR